MKQKYWFMICCLQLIALLLVLNFNSIKLQKAERNIAIKTKHVKELQAELVATKVDLAHAKKLANPKTFIRERRGVLFQYVKSHSNLHPYYVKKNVEAALSTQYPLLMAAIAKHESNYYPQAISNVGAVGPCQIYPVAYQLKLLKANGIAETRQQLFNIATNYKAGEFLLCKKLQRTKNLRYALQMYVGNPSSAEAYNYASNVLRSYRVLMQKVLHSKSKYFPANITKPKAIKHKIKAGETLYRILSKHTNQVTPKLIQVVAEANGLSNPNLIYPGKILRIPRRAI